MDTEQRALLARARLVAFKRDQAALRRPCATCRFGPIDGSGQGKCEHLAHWEIAPESLSGRAKLHIPVTTAEARSEGGLCGPEGLLWEPYSFLGKVGRWLAVMKPGTFAIGGLWLIMGVIFGAAWLYSLLFGS